MPQGWTPKSTSPAAFNLAEEFVGVITGQPDSWLAPWAHLVGGSVENTTNFCTHVDLDPPPLAPSDFFYAIPGGLSPIQIGLAEASLLLQIGPKLATYAAARVGQVFCEQIVAHTTTGCTHVSGVVSSDNYWFSVPVIAGSDHVEIDGGAGGGIAGGLWSNTINSTGPVAPYLDIGSWGTVGSDIYFPVVSGWAYLSLRPIPGIYTVQFCGTAGGTVDHPPTPQAPIPDLPNPTTLTYPDITALGRELDRQEQKIDQALSLIRYLVQSVAPPAITIGSENPASGIIPLQQATGIVVTVSAIPAFTDEQFGDPVKYHRLGRITFGTTDAWFQPIDISENPLIIAPLPPFVTRVQVSVRPPATATVRLIS